MHWCLSQSYYKGIVQSSLFSFDLIVHFAYIGHRFQQLGTVLVKKTFIEEMNELNAFVDGHWRCNYYTFPSV